MDPSSIRAGTVNVNNFINKIRPIVNFLGVQRLDLLAICKTWLTSKVSISFVDIYVYSFFRKDVAGVIRKHSVGSYFRNNIQTIRIDVSVAHFGRDVLKWDTFIIVSY